MANYRLRKLPGLVRKRPVQHAKSSREPPIKHVDWIPVSCGALAEYLSNDVLMVPACRVSSELKLCIWSAKTVVTSSSVSQASSLRAELEVERSRRAAAEAAAEAALYASAGGDSAQAAVA